MLINLDILVFIWISNFMNLEIVFNCPFILGEYEFFNIS